MVRLTHALHSDCELLIVDCLFLSIVKYFFFFNFLQVFLYFYGGTLKPKAKVIITFLTHSLLQVSLAVYLNPFLYWSDNIFLQANSEPQIQLPSFTVCY